MTDVRAIPRKQLFQYGFLALPMAFAGLPLYLHAPDFFTRDLSADIGIIGAILIFIRLFDAVQDPYIGYLSDRFPQKRFGFLMIGAVFLSMGMAGLFAVPQNPLPLFVSFGLSMLLATTGFSIVAININTIGGLWHNDKTQRTRITGWREAFGLGGLVSAAILPQALQKYYPAETSFLILFLAFIVLLSIALVLFYAALKNIPEKVAQKEAGETSKFLLFNLLWGRETRFFSVCFLTHIAAAMPAVLVLFFIKDYLQAESMTGLFLLFYFLSGALFMGGWIKASDKYGKENAWLASMVLAVVTFFWAFLLQPGDVYAFMIICLLSGIAFGADLALPPSIMADRIENNDHESKASQYFALLSFIPKFAFAMTSGIALLTLDIFNFQPGEENTSQALTTLVTFYALIPCIIKLLAAWSLFSMQRTERKSHENDKRSLAYGTYDATH